MRAGAFGCSCLLLPYWDVPSNSMLGCHPRCWSHLAGVLSGVIIYSRSTVIIKIYPAISVAIWGRGGVDGTGYIWISLLSIVLFGKTFPDLVQAVWLLWVKFAAGLVGFHFS